MRSYTQLIFSIVFFVILSHHTYIAWFKPEQHKLDLAAMGKSYRSWSPYTEQWVASAFGFWLTRFAYLFAFAIASIALIRELVLRLFG